MRGLIYKDFYLIKSKLLMSIVSILFDTALLFVILNIIKLDYITKTKGADYLSVMLFFIELFVVIAVWNTNYANIMKLDTSRQWGFYGISSPVTEKGIVAARYFTIFILLFLTYVICVIFDVVFGLVCGTAMNMSFFILFILFFNALKASIEMPLAFRFGQDKSTLIRILITTIIVIIILIYLLFGNIDWIMADGGTLKTLLRLIVDGDLAAGTLAKEMERS